MKNAYFLFLALLGLSVQSCHRPVGYFQRQPHVAARLPVQPDSTARVLAQPDLPVADTFPDSRTGIDDAVASLVSTYPTRERIARRMQRVERMRLEPVQVTDGQPRPRPGKRMRLGNRIRESLGMPLRQELNWWQRISWKLKASVIVILVAVVFAILHLGVLSIVFGLLGAFLLITGLKRSFKVRRPWF